MSHCTLNRLIHHHSFPHSLSAIMLSSQLSWYCPLRGDLRKTWSHSCYGHCVKSASQEIQWLVGSSLCVILGDREDWFVRLRAYAIRGVHLANMHFDACAKHSNPNSWKRLVAGHTPRLHCGRGYEIAQWLQENDCEGLYNSICRCSSSSGLLILFFMRALLLFAALFPFSITFSSYLQVLATYQSFLTPRTDL